MHTNLTTEKLANLLEAAEKAHAEYEKTLDGTDDDWAQWYSEYIMEKLEK